LKLHFAPSRKLAARRLEIGGHRIYDPRERLLLAGFDGLLRLAAPLLGLLPRGGPPLRRDDLRQVLALRLDRMGDLVMTLPALSGLRRLLPEARIVLAVGSWNEELARGLPSFAWRTKASWRTAARSMRRAGPPDLALDFQGDVRSIVLMAMTGARYRAGYGDTGGGVLLTHRARWDERRSWYRQNLELLSAAVPDSTIEEAPEPFNFLLGPDRERGRELLARTVADGSPRPWVGVHPSAGRAIKQWEVEKFAMLVDRLGEAAGGTILLTGAPEDRELVRAVAARARRAPIELTGAASVRPFAAALEALDLFIGGDTGPLHLAHAVGTPALGIFGPTDPRRYGPEDENPRRAVVRKPLYCSPCNMVRRPPRECSALEAPECLASIAVDDVIAAAIGLLQRSVEV
jgi:ADP-heptose:LPS heptosyltransferase